MLNKRIFSLIAITCLLLSCSINKNFKTVKYPVGNNDRKLILRIPKGYSFTKASWEGLDDAFKYNDSSIIYVTTEIGGINYINIKEAGKLDSLSYIKSEGGSFIVSGIDVEGLYWKNYLYGRYNIGYKNVRGEKKELFDKIINDVHVK